MLAVSFLQWWYTRGWEIYFRGFRERIHNLADFFSIGLLLKTLFSPFRQISAGETSQNGGPAGAFAVFTDKLVSRVIGFLVRFFIIIFGTILMLLQLIGGLILALLWPCVPLLPLVGFALAVLGVHF